MQKIMASPGVIDGAATPEDMYSPSKNAHCCGLSTECIVCMHARAHTSTKEDRLACTYTGKNTIQESTQQQIFKREAAPGLRPAVEVDLALPLVRTQATAATG